ncbi:MAG: aminomethyl-transferring glycine dehydrogenase subunit GcvPA, partial [Candidatus Ranarchaeia archaeon]
VYLEQPSYFGILDPNAQAVGELIHDKNGLLVVGIDPTSLGVIKAPGDYGADIAVGEGQPLGNPVSYGGPLLGIFACKDDKRLIRQMPGRIVGLTTTMDGQERAFTLALATREQHIRRERATSNICSNQALVAVNAAIYMAALGPSGFKTLGETILYNSNYAMKRLADIAGLKSPLFKAAHFKEFVVNFDDVKIPVVDIHAKLLREGVHGGRIITNEYPNYGQSMLFCVTELHTKNEIELLVQKINDIVEGGF